MQTGKRTAEKRWTKSTILAQIFCVIMLVIWLYPLIKIIQISFRSGGIENYKRVLFTVDSSALPMDMSRISLIFGSISAIP